MNTTPPYLSLSKVSSNLDPLQPIHSSAFGASTEFGPDLNQNDCWADTTSPNPDVCPPALTSNWLLHSRGAVLHCPKQRILQSSAFGGDGSHWLGNKLGSLSGMEGCQLFVGVFRCIDAMVMTLFSMCLELRIRSWNESKINCLIHVSRGSKHPTRYRQKISFK